MPAVSQAQQKLMGMAYALKKGDMKPEEASQEVKDLADSMSLEDLKDFATTSHEGLPAKKESEETPKTDKPKNIKTFEEFVSDMKGESVNAEGDEVKDTKEVEEEDNKRQVESKDVNEEAEGKMYKTHLTDIIENAQKILGMIEDSEDLEAWVQDKIVIADHNMDAIAGYYSGEKETGKPAENPNIAKDILITDDK